MGKFASGIVDTDAVSITSSRSRPQTAGSIAFDILPLRGSFGPGESHTVEVCYYATPGQRASATAVCQVEGGPSYRVPLSAESSTMR
jgi:hydrocephalus-inducing protein